MRSPLLSELAELTGEELYHLLGKLNRACETWQAKTLKARNGTPRRVSFESMWAESLETRAVVLVQIARITFPICDAQRIAYTQHRLRRGPVPMHPTYTNKR